MFKNNQDNRNKVREESWSDRLANYVYDQVMEIEGNNAAKLYNHKGTFTSSPYKLGAIFTEAN